MKIEIEFVVHQFRFVCEKARKKAIKSYRDTQDKIINNTKKKNNMIRINNNKRQRCRYLKTAC